MGIAREENRSLAGFYADALDYFLTEKNGRLTER